MIRYGVTLLMMVFGVTQAVAGSWAESLFDETSKDFGSVARGSALAYPFRLVNRTEAPVHIAGVRVSCGCVTAIARVPEVQPGQETAIHVQMDTGRFQGDKNVTVFVQFDRPAVEEVRLQVRANSRDDITVTPPSLDLGHASRTGTASTRVVVSLLGNADWRIVDTVSESKWVETALKELNRQGGQAAYELTAQLLPGLPAGSWYNEIWLKTNLAGLPAVRVPLVVEIEPVVTVSPAAITLGPVKVGDKVEGKVLIRGAQPFRIKAVTPADAQWTVQATGEEKPLHVLTVTLQGQKAGLAACSFRVQTNLKEENTVVFTAQAQVVP
jgi:hypothetical protein